MWFRPGNGQSVDFEKFRVSSFKRRIRGRKLSEKASSIESSDNLTMTVDHLEKQDLKNSDKSHQKKPSSCNNDNSVLRSSLSRRISKSFGEKGKEKEKEKVLLTDRKFKNNRIEKSSSKGKINDLDKRDSIKGRRGDARKISAPPILESKTAKGVISPSVAVAKKNARVHSTLNLNALYKLVGSSGSKKLSSEDFERIRRKSLSEAAAPVIAVATSKLPLTLNGGVVTTPSIDEVNVDINEIVEECEGRANGDLYEINDLVIGVGDGNVNNNIDPVNYWIGNVNGNGNVNVNINDNTNHQNGHVGDENIDEENGEVINLKKNNSVEFEDDVFLHQSQPNVAAVAAAVDANKNINKKISSPSLTSRVAAKISETTNNYKNRKSKTPKKRKSARRPELYKQISTDRPHSTSVVRQPSDRRPDLASTSISSSGTASHNTSELTPSHSLDVDSNALAATENDSKRDRSKSKSAPVSVNRSESYKERLSHKRNRTNRRKTSDPSLSKTNDEQSELGLSNANYTASSSSSLSSSSLESPSTSLEQVGGPHAVPQQAGLSSTSGPMTTATGTVPTPRQWVDSEDEAEFIEIDWSSNISTDVLASLSDAEKKRQEIINEIYQTERNHVRTLRLLEGLFMRPLQESGVLPTDHLQILFPPALFSLKELHGAFEQKLKVRRIEHGYIVRNVGDLLIEMFDGQSGDELRDYSAQFCLRQQIALEALKEKRRKDENLQRLLTKAESHKACRRLQLKDLLPTVMQRLTKYPLLFENLYKVTKRVVPDDENEADAIQRALDSSKRILSDVNQAVKIVEDAHKLQTIQRKLDKSGLDKDEFRNLDLTQYKLIHDGQLTMKKIPGVQLHGLLFDNMMVLLHKQDDKYFLKYFPNLAAKTDEANKLISPITHFGQQTLVRQSAVDKNAFFLIITKTSQMLELRAPSSSECKKWFKHISDAAEQYKPRSKSSHEVVEDPASATLPHSNTKESLETTPDRTATASTTTHTNLIQESGLPSVHPHNEIKDRNDSFTSVKNKNSFEDSNQTEKENSSQEDSNITGKKSNITEEQDKQNGLRPNNHDEGRRDSVYSNNSNETRTLMQMCPLLEPSEIHISISPAPVAEPVVTPAERLKQLDQAIRERLAEKQKIICDMFRVPNEHFAEIVDIAAQPEAPKDTSDIALAAFAQVQSLMEVLNEHMKITTVQEISAVSTAVCDQCHYRNMRSVSPVLSSVGSTNTGTTVIPNSERENQNNLKDASLDETIIQEDDGYCEIDELRLPAVVPNPMSTSLTGGQKPVAIPSVHISTSTPELIKRQSTISADSIPEETEQDITNDEQASSSNSPSIKDDESILAVQSETSTDEQQKGLDDSLNNSEHIEVNETYDATPKMSTATTPMSFTKSNFTSNYASVVGDGNQLQNTFGNGGLCGPNRLLHVQSLEPSVPCHILSGIVTALGAQISLLLPKINEREVERERLRRENQRLRELLNSMHENRRVAEETETPDITESAKKEEDNSLLTDPISPSSQQATSLSSLTITSADNNLVKENN